MGKKAIVTQCIPAARANTFAFGWVDYRGKKYLARQCEFIGNKFDIPSDSVVSIICADGESLIVQGFRQEKKQS